jgi:hypothetical protein
MIPKGGFGISKDNTSRGMLDDDIGKTRDHHH